MFFYNTKSRVQLIKELEAETFRRVTMSFYRYIMIDDPVGFRDDLYVVWSQWSCRGRVYVAREGINAQMSIPEHHLETFLSYLDANPELKDMPIKYAVEDNGKSFYKLTIKVRPRIVADGLDDDAFDVTDVGTHLEPLQFHELSAQQDTIVIDMRNHYECEVGHFKGAYTPQADTFREAIIEVDHEFTDRKDKKILLYCTGGIRCEKASAYLRHRGYSDVNQLHGGIIAYAHEVKAQGLEPRFTGKNFVFDERLGESIDGKVISHCHQCGAPCDIHTNCANDDCHLLFLQCPKCAARYDGCCSRDCKHVKALPEIERKKMRRIRHKKYSESKIFKSRLRPSLMEQMRKHEIILKQV